MANHTLVLAFSRDALSTSGRIAGAARAIQAQIKAEREVVVVTGAIGHDIDRIHARLDRLAGREGGRRRERDRALASAAALAAALLATQLCALGIQAVSLSGEEAGFHGAARGGSASSPDPLVAGVDPFPIRRRLARGQVPVVAAVRGPGRRVETGALGRGAAQTTAVALAAALGCVPCHLLEDAVASGHDRTAAPQRGRRTELTQADLLRLADAGAPAERSLINSGALRLALAYHVPLTVYGEYTPGDPHASAGAGIS